jgi:hypothetical protein
MMNTNARRVCATTHIGKYALGRDGRQARRRQSTRIASSVVLAADHAHRCDRRRPCMPPQSGRRARRRAASAGRLRREGHAMGVNRARWLWRQAGLGLPRKGPRRRVAASRPRPLPPHAANQVLAYDFVFDSCANGQQLKCLTVVDEFTHECLAIDVAGSIRSGRVIEVLSRSLVERHQRVPQRQVPRRMPERRVVPHPPRSPGHHRGVAAALQRYPPTFQPRLLDPARIQAGPSTHSRPPQPSLFPGMNGSMIRTQVSGLPHLYGLDHFMQFSAESCPVITG